MAKTHHDLTSILANRKVLSYCEGHGIYEIFSRRGNVITYYSFYNGEGFYKVKVNVTKPSTMVRKRMKTYRIGHLPKFLIGEHGTKYNYCEG